MGHRIASSQADYPDAEVEKDVLDSMDTEVVVGNAPSEKEVVELAAGADALLVKYAHVTESVLDEFAELTDVSRYGIGVATDRGVMVTNVSSYCEKEVATHALSLLLTVVRKTAMYTAAIKSGIWDWKIGQPIEPLVGNTLGFVAFGKIPRTLARLASRFDFEYLVYDPYLDEEEIGDDSIRMVGFETLLSESDIISVHTPLVEETHHMFDADVFWRMPATILINTARGREHALWGVAGR